MDNQRRQDLHILAQIDQKEAEIERLKRERSSIEGHIRQAVYEEMLAKLAAAEAKDRAEHRPASLTQARKQDASWAGMRAMLAAIRDGVGEVETRARVLDAQHRARQDRRSL